MLCDYHIHSSISADSETDPQEQIRRAAEIGLEEICFTEHLELHFHRGDAYHTNLKEYSRRYENYDRSIVKVKFGIEAGIAMEPRYFPELEAELRSVSPDFVIASAHSIDNLDPFNPEYFEGKTMDRVFSDYIVSIIKGIRLLDTGLYSSIGHIDFPSKGTHTEKDPRLLYRHAPDEIDALFQYIIPQGKCIEVNTASYRVIEDLDIPGEDWLRRYVELGGEHVTFGSDAHRQEHIGYRLMDAAEMARRAGIKYYATYDKMIPTFHKL